MSCHNEWGGSTAKLVTDALVEFEEEAAVEVGDFR